MAKLKAVADYNRDITQAWNVIRLYGAAMSKKRIPALKTYLLRAEPPKPVTPEERFAQAKSSILAMSKMYGGRVRYLTPNPQAAG